MHKWILTTNKLMHKGTIHFKVTRVFGKDLQIACLEQCIIGLNLEQGQSTVKETKSSNIVLVGVCLLSSLFYNYKNYLIIKFSI